MRDRIGFVGIGQCGGNIVQLFEKEGYKCLAINTSNEDLDTVDVRFKYKIPESEGCSHDRATAINLVKKYNKDIVNEIKDKLGDRDIIYMVFSAGGGTGSGSSSILFRLLSATLNNIFIGCVVVLPSDEEETQIKINAYQCYKEISSQENIASVFTLDNNYTDKLLLNEIFVEYFNNMTNMINYKGQKGNIDKSELLKMLKQRGNSIISVCQNKPEEDLLTCLFNSWENNIFAPIEKDKKLMYLGLSLHEDIDIETVRDYIGKPWDTFTNYNDKCTISLLSGLSFPNKRIEKIIADIDKEKDRVKGIMTHAKNNKIVKEIDWLDEINNITKVKKVEVSLDDILSQY